MLTWPILSMRHACRESLMVVTFIKTNIHFKMRSEYSNHTSLQAYLIKGIDHFAAYTVTITS